LASVCYHTEPRKCGGEYHSSQPGDKTECGGRKRGGNYNSPNTANNTKPFHMEGGDYQSPHSGYCTGITQPSEHCHSSSSIEKSEGGASLKTTPVTIEDYKSELKHLQEINSEQDQEFIIHQHFLDGLKLNIIAAEHTISAPAQI